MGAHADSSSNQELLAGFESWCEKAYRRLQNLIDSMDCRLETFRSLGDFWYYTSAIIVRQAWEFAVFLSAHELIELCWPQLAMRPVTRLIASRSAGCGARNNEAPTLLR